MAGSKGTNPPPVGWSPWIGVRAVPATPARTRIEHILLPGPNSL